MPANPFSGQLILGHRGAPDEATENTLRSFDLALVQGADGVELDVQRSSDGVPVVLHDATLRRTMAARWHVKDLPWPAIERLTNAQVPSFAQAAAWAAASGAWLDVEIKAPGVEVPILRSLTRAGLRGRAVVSSFEATILRRLAELDAGVMRFLLTKRWNEESRAKLQEAKAAGICLHADAADDATLADLGKHHLPVVVWTVNEPAAVRRLLDAGVAGIITDAPAMAVSVRDATSTG